MKIIEAIKRTDRTLLEMHIGQLFFGLVCQLFGLFFVHRQGSYAAGLWFGIACSMVAAVHMARTLDRALLMGDAAAKVITRGYIFRYLMFIVFLIVVSVTGIMHPLTVFLGYMSLKVTAYIQPFTHKFLNRLLHETDPVPEPMAAQEPAAPEGQAPSDMDGLC